MANLLGGDAGGAGRRAGVWAGRRVREQEATRGGLAGGEQLCGLTSLEAEVKNSEAGILMGDQAGAGAWAGRAGGLSSLSHVLNILEYSRQSGWAGRE